MPMNSDILKIEPFLIPVLLLLPMEVGANANFLKNNFKETDLSI